MAHLLRGKQAGIQNDLSAGLGPHLFVLDDIKRFGINSQISQIAYDPVQALLAVGTNETQFGAGQIYVFGQQRIDVVLPLPRRASVRILQFCGDKIICLDAKNDLSIFSLETKQLIASYSPPAKISAVHSDPTLDYVLLGTQTGDILAYDLDRENLAPFKIPNFWREQNPRARLTPVVTISFHPRDIGTLLIGYSDGAVIYSFKQNKVLKSFQYELPRGAPGGDSDPSSINMARKPALTQAIWHPTGTFILTGHEDSSLVFWDPKDGRVVMARTLSDTNVDKPGGGSTTHGVSPGTFAFKAPLFRIAWCANQDPDDTAILFSGGAPTTLPTKGLTLLELGRTPVYATSSWQVLSDHFESPKRQRILPTPANAEVVDFCLIPRSSPHFAGAHDPIAVLALLSSGEVITLSFPSGLPISPTNQLHPSMTFVHPFITHANLAPIERTRWLGMTERRAHGPPILRGGAEARHPLKRFESRNIVQTAHADGTIRLWDAGHGDEIENEALLQANVNLAVGRYDAVDVALVSLSGATGELAVGLKTGEVVMFRWGHNKNAGREPPPPTQNTPKKLTNITERQDPALTEGLLPFTLLNEQNGPVSALKMSDVGFVAAGFEGGSLSVIDLRGPAIIYSANVQDFVKSDKRGSFRRSGSQGAAKVQWPTTLEFSVMTLDGDDYSSILLHVGTNLGQIATFKLLPDSSGRYSVQFAGSSSLDDRVIRIAPLTAETGRPAHASQGAVSNLRSGIKVNGVLLAVTQSGVRLFKPAAQRGAHKTFDSVLCDSAAVVRYEEMGYALLGLFGDGYARAYSIPALKEIGSVKLSDTLDIRRFSEANITSTGDILAWKGPAEMALVNVFGTGLKLNQSKDILFNPQLTIPPRPTISNLQWISGTQYITPSDMDLLIGGPDRPPSKRMLMQARADEQQRRADARGPHTASSSAAGGSDEAWGAYLQRQLNERTEKLGLAGDSMDKLESNSAGWADDVGKFVQKQKRNMVLGAVKGKFGF
ncbi:uncharacterized protein BDZ99DRAFT_516184 [Mytilinidion resinicola]|uniref:Lethal giant larvae (Lgl)-like C-terminal domain-containing protein n=1 Tax=Mytilinidion resinicola TaxID=574789 RepID=A0A6A6Z597_9PEZI|nr:uncharacterized protein BDZ99DRAFT_516184 [Mytilinidion resinicola]KAF2815464.1 hypothetical protein BDZ99DRAFT_516184 [Mytilinidion resinicola]